MSPIINHGTTIFIYSMRGCWCCGYYTQRYVTIKNNCNNNNLVCYYQWHLLFVRRFVIITNPFLLSSLFLRAFCVTASVFGFSLTSLPHFECFSEKRNPFWRHVRIFHVVFKFCNCLCATYVYTKMVCACRVFGF